MSKILHIFLFILSTYFLFGQPSENLKLPEPKRLIDRVEIFAGSNLSFNYGNMFVENYRDDYADNNYVTNKRLLKFDYLFGIGAYHSFTNRIGLNVRMQYEQKGSKNELNNPLNPVNDDTRQITKDEYTYSYFTINTSPTFYFGRKNRWMISFGAYYSKIKNLRGSSESYNTLDFQANKDSFEGRYFYHLREDGGMDGFAWMPHLTSIEDYDWGLITSIGYKIPFNQKHSTFIQLQDNFGLKNINKNNPYNLEEKNHSFSLIISYTYHLPPKSLRL
ncbi:MAG TPA: hypothetical protein PLV21_13625 [Cyclobacteriaceae bacterium]|nr:hypothetical protein [Cyclobacteriaceae bacterium]